MDVIWRIEYRFFEPGLATHRVRVKDFAVYNRWGQRVFQTANVPANDKHYGWNGRLNGQLAESGGYVYNITIELDKGRTESYHGVIMLIR